MKRILLLALCIICIIGTASAYQLYLTCPSDKSLTDPISEIQVGIPLKCSIDSNLPAGTTFNLAFYESQYTATLVSKQAVTIQENHNTQYKLFDTQGLPGGTYKIETEFIGSDESRLSSDSVSMQQVTLVDRSGEIDITSPMTQNLADALRIEGSISHLGSDGVKIEVRGPDGVVFREQYIPTTNNIKDGSGSFTKKVVVTSAGSYEVDFADSKSYIGKATFTVTAPATEAPTAVPTTTAPLITKTKIPTTVPTPWPTATQSPLSPLTILCAAGFAGLLVVLAGRTNK